MSKTHKKNKVVGKGLSGHGVRNELAVAAFKATGAGRMKDRREERGGAKNRQREYLSERY